MRFSSRFLAACTGVAVIAIVAQVAIAQNERGQRNRGGRGGGPGGMGGPVSMARLASIDKVQDALKLTDDQKAKIKTISDEGRKQMEEMRSAGGQPDFEKMRKIGEDSTAKVNAVLDEGQQKRLMGIFVQVAGTRAVMDPAVAKELNITDEQKTKFHEAMGPPPGGGDRQSFADRRTKMEKEIMDLLTSDQKQKLESLKGEKVDIDMSQLRGPGGGQRPGRGERRNRGNDQPNEKKSA